MYKHMHKIGYFSVKGIHKILLLVAILLKMIPMKLKILLGTQILLSNTQDVRKHKRK